MDSEWRCFHRALAEHLTVPARQMRQSDESFEYILSNGKETRAFLVALTIETRLNVPVENTHALPQAHFSHGVQAVAALDSLFWVMVEFDHLICIRKVAT